MNDENQYNSEEEIEYFSDEEIRVYDQMDNLSPEDWNEITADKYKEYYDYLIPAESNIDLYCQEPYDVFEKIITDEIFELLAEETNRYHKQFIRDNPNYLSNFKQSHIKDFKELTKEMMKSFIGILYLLGINIRTNILDHWSSNPLLNSPISNYISSDKFQLYWKFLHCNNNDNIKSNKSQKITNIIDLLNKRWKDIYNPSSKLAIDETMVFNRGKNPFIQYCPMKPIKFGTKLWSLADSSNGYMLHVKIYEGKGNKNTKTESLSEKVVIELLEPYKNKDKTVYMDSFYSNPSLFHQLSRNGFDAIGMVMINRKLLSDEIKKRKVQKGEHIFSENKDVMILQWNDKKAVNLLSTVKCTSTGEYEKYDIKKKEKIILERPLLIFDYIRHMRAVDRNNQLSSYYSITIKQFKWWRSIFLKLLDISMSNAYILYKSFSKLKELDHKEFCLAVIERLLAFHDWKKEKIIFTIDVKMYYSNFENGKRRKCKSCHSNRNKRTDTKFFCSLCNSKFSKYVTICRQCQRDHILTHLNTF